MADENGEEKKEGLRLVDIEKARQERRQGHPNRYGIVGQVDEDILECGNAILEILKTHGCYLEPMIEQLGGGIFRPAIQLKKIKIPRGPGG